MPPEGCEICGEPAAVFVQDLVRVSRPDQQGEPELRPAGRAHAFCLEHKREPDIGEEIKILPSEVDGENLPGPSIAEAAAAGDKRVPQSVVRSLRVVIGDRHFGQLVDGGTVHFTPRPDCPSVEIRLEDIGFARMRELITAAEV